MREIPAQRYWKAQDGTGNEPDHPAHNPKVAGSDPAPATIRTAGEAPLLGVGPPVVSAATTGPLPAATGNGVAAASEHAWSRRAPNARAASSRMPGRRARRWPW